MTGLRVHGGAGGTVAVLEDLEHAATLLRRVAAGLLVAGARVTAAVAAPGWAATAPLAPLSFDRAVAELALAVAGPHGVGPQAVRAEVLGDGVAAAAEAYRAADLASAEVLEAARREFGRAVGAPLIGSLGLPLLAAAGVQAARGDGRAMFTLMGNGDAVEWFADVLAGTTTGALGPLVVAVAGHDGPGTAAGSGAAVAGLLGLAAGVAAAGTRGALIEPGGGLRIHVEPAAGPVPARGVADLVRRVPSTEEPAPRVRLERIDSPAGRAWVVGIPGTSSWNPRPGADPFDLTSDVQVLAGRRAPVAEGVLTAMREAGVRKGEPVLLAGHSLGGLVAASLAADPVARREFTITHVVTTGAPVAGVPLPDDVQVLSLEHDEDVVPHLDGDPNPDRPGWVTVERSVRADDQVHDLARERPAIAHDQELYVETAAQVDVSRDPSVAHWRAGSARFLDPAGTVTAFDASVSRAG